MSYTLTLRSSTTTKLTNTQMDNNFLYLQDLANVAITTASQNTDAILALTTRVNGMAGSYAAVHQGGGVRQGNNQVFMGWAPQYNRVAVTIDSTDCGNIVFDEHLEQYAAPKVSPNFTGIPTVPTPPSGNSSDRIASTAYVQNAIADAIQATLHITIPSTASLYTTSTTIQKPLGTTGATIEVVSGGGSGSNSNGSNYGGQSGTYASYNVSFSSTATESMTIIIGAAGRDSDTNWSAGGAGGDTSVSCNVMTPNLIQVSGGAASQNTIPLGSYSAPPNLPSYLTGYGTGGTGYSGANNVGTYGSTQGCVRITWR